MEPGFNPRSARVQSLDSVALCSAPSGEGGRNHRDLELHWAGRWASGVRTALCGHFTTHEASTLPSTLRQRNFSGVSHGEVMALLDGKEWLRKVLRGPGALTGAPTPLPRTDRLPGARPHGCPGGDTSQAGRPLSRLAWECVCKWGIPDHFRKVLSHSAQVPLREGNDLSGKCLVTGELRLRGLA